MGNFVIRKTKDSKFMFNLKAGNGAIIATSETYNTLDACKKGIESVRNNSVKAATEDQTVKNYDTEKKPKFEIFKDKAGEFRFRLLATNSEIIIKSEGYTVKASCKNGITSVIKNAPIADIIEK